MGTTGRLIVAITLCVSACHAQFFPKSSLDSRGDDFKANWYSAQLRALEEPSLLDLADHRPSHSYRFLWLRTFNHPVAIRIDIKPDGTGLLTIKACSGAGGFAPGTLIENMTQALSDIQVNSFLELVDRVDFWSAPNPVEDQTGTDGSEWIIEGVRDGKYHVVDRWMPERGVARELGVFLAFDLAKMNLPKRDIY